MSDARTTETWKTYDFLQKLKKVVWLALYGPAISQSDCRKTGPYQLPYSNDWYFARILRYFSLSCKNLTMRQECFWYAVRFISKQMDCFYLCPEVFIVHGVPKK